MNYFDLLDRAHKALAKQVLAAIDLEVLEDPNLPRKPRELSVETTVGLVSVVVTQPKKIWRDDEGRVAIVTGQIRCKGVDDLTRVLAIEGDGLEARVLLIDIGAASKGETKGPWAIDMSGYGRYGGPRQAYLKCEFVETMQTLAGGS